MTIFMVNLLSDIERFCRDHGISERRFGSEVMNDGKLVAQLRAGRDLRVSTVNRIRAWMAEYPAKAALPI